MKKRTIHQQHSAKRATSPRRGAILACVLVCLFVITLLAAGLLKTIASRQRQISTQHQQVQMTWLFQSARGRAIAKLKNSPDYRGETWQINSDLLGGNQAAVAVIQIKTPAASANQRQISIEVRYPNNAPNAMRKKKKLTIHLTQAGVSP